MADQNRLVSARLQNEVDQRLDTTLRPQSLSEFVGQEKLKKNLSIFLAAAKKRGSSLEHTLLYGGPGLGKTTLAHIIAREIGAGIKVTSGPAIERAGDLAAILTNLQENEVLFIDEIHRLNKVIEEVLYPAMEDYALDIVLGKGPQARTLRLELPNFTLIGATTRLSLLSPPLRDRFGSVYRLDFYTLEEIEQIINRSAQLLGVELDHQSVSELAQRARRTPRVANRLLKRVRDYAEIEGDGRITLQLAKEALNLLEVDQMGLDEIDRRILLTVIEKFKGGPVGLGSIAAAIAEEQTTIEEIYEPYLLQLGFLERTARGRRVTHLAYQHLGLQAPTEVQKN